MEEDEYGYEKFVWNPKCQLASYSAAVYSVDFSPDGKLFVSGSNDNLVRICDSKTGVEVSSLVGARSRWWGDD